MGIVTRQPTEANRSGMCRYGMLSEGIFDDYVQGKKIIVVGPAGYLQDKKLGEYIEGFDVVVRINHAIPIKNTEDYGTRTDLLYHILSHRGSNGIHKDVVDRDEINQWKHSGLKYLVSRHDQYSKRIRMIKYNLMLLKWTTVGERFYRQLKHKIGKKNPNTGLLAIMHLLSLDVKSVNVIGFDFYRSGVYKGYGDIGRNEDAEKVNERWHDTEAQLKFLKGVVKEEKRLILDKVLEDILCDVQL